MKMTRAENIILALCAVGGLLFAFALKSFGGDEVWTTNAAIRPLVQDVIIDDFRYVAIAPSVWDDLTNTVERLKDMSAKRWNMEHKTVAGRAAWHGQATNRIVSATSVTWLYADGYTYTETDTNAVKRVRPPTAPKRLPSAPAKKPSPTLPPRLAEKREAMKSRAGEVREVNAVFGPGGKVLKVEEAK